MGKNFYIIKYNLKPGDRIVTPKSALKWVQHHVIYLGQNYDGVDLIIENKIGHGVRIITADQFFTECPIVTRIEPFSGTGWERQAAIKRALDNVGQPYSLINFNCESFAELVQHNKIKSNQANTGLIIAGVALLIGIAAAVNSNNKRR